MTRKQDLLLEAHNLNIKIDKKDTIAILCQKIDDAGVQSKNCQSGKGKRSPSNKKITKSKPSLIKTKSPKTKSPKTKSPKTKSPKSSKSKSPSTTFENNRLNIDFSIKNDKVKLNINNEKKISVEDLLTSLDFIKSIINEKYDNKNITSNLFAINKDLTGLNEIIDYSGIDKYMKMKEKIIFLGLSVDSFERENILSKKIVNIALYSSNNKKYYILELTLIIPEFMGTHKQRDPFEFKSALKNANKKQCDLILSYTHDDYFGEFDHFVENYVNNTKQPIIFDGYGKKTNFKINYDQLNDYFFELPEFIDRAEPDPNDEPRE